MQLAMHMVTIEDLMPREHFLRKLEAALDLSFVYEETAPLYSKKYGRPPIDPVVIVKYLLVGFLYGIPSERQIERRIQTDIALRWYLGFDRVPDHSTVSQLRRRQPRDCFLLKCSRCGRICHLDCSHLKALYDHLERNHHFHIDPCGTLFTGLCELCVRDKDFHGTD